MSERPRADWFPGQTFVLSPESEMPTHPGNLVGRVSGEEDRVAEALPPNALRPYPYLTDETLERLERAPSTFAAWVVRAAVQELRTYRAEA